MRPPRPDDLVTLIEEDHREIERRFEEVEASGKSTRAEALWKLADQLVRHEVAEEAVLYPALRSVPGGDAIVRRRLEEQARAEEDLARLEKLDLHSADCDHALAKLRDEVLSHAKEEEVQAIPFLAGSRSGDDMVELGLRYTEAKLSPPNRPHPPLPYEPPPRQILRSVAALSDRVRDAVGKL